MPRVGLKYRGKRSHEDLTSRFHLSTTTKRKKNVIAGVFTPIIIAYHNEWLMCTIK